MAADVLSPRSDPGSAAQVGINRTSLPPLVTSPPSKAKLERASSYANKRLSTFSNASNTQAPARSRPQSIAFPAFHSSLPYSLVRDFAYDPLQPLFYGPLPEQPSDISAPASEHGRRLSDPPPVAWRNDRGAWSAASWEEKDGEQLPQMAYDGGPPYSEDDDISSPVVTSHHMARHKKHKSNVVNFDHTRGRRGYPEEQRRRSTVPTNGESSRFVSEDAANAPAGEYITYPPESSRLAVPDGVSRRDSHFATTLLQRAYADADADTEGPPYESDDDMSEPEDYIHDDSRFSRDYQFTIASPDEEMHGKAVALFDFARENDNELPLVEGQVILVSYRHGQGWLVAQDPKTGESGLVPEEYVRLLRDIEGGWNGLMNGAIQSQLHPPPQDAHNGSDSLLSPVSAGPEAKTPTQADHPQNYTPVISTFSTSHKDLEKYPTDKLGTPTNTEGGHFGKAKDSCPMEGVETTPEPQSQEQKS
ncbi:hypothetical protein EJ02DRAFT_350763 [Clathrospora elynae]|uniref:SH3 domain-containing protein n=1 Tax=Clathrospora elynae TaxID=706981 RepID=A0A6A5SHJ9_9PLEO|nr:hypothetical protein EJ02DRAFT_350763 [Clathrospora elynae]